MARISTYQLDDTLEFDDRVIGTDTSSNNATMNFSLDQLGEFYSRSGRAQSSITFTFDVGVPYSNTGVGPMDVEAGHIYFNSSDWSGVTEMVISTTTNLGVGTQALAGVVYGQALAINQVGDDRGEAYGFFEGVEALHEEVIIGGTLVGYRVGIQGFTHPADHPDFINYQGTLPSDYVSITPFGVANIVGTEQNLAYTVVDGELSISDGNAVEILGFDVSGVDPQIVFEGNRYSLGHSNLDVEGSSTITITGTNNERIVNVASSVISSIVAAQDAADNASQEAGAAQTTADNAAAAAAQAQAEVDAIEGDVAANTAARHDAITITNVTDPSSYTNAVVHDVELVGQEIRITYEEDGINPATPNQTIRTLSPITGAVTATDGNVVLGFDASAITNAAPNVTINNVTNPATFTNPIVTGVALSSTVDQQIDITYAEDTGGTEVARVASPPATADPLNGISIDGTTYRVTTGSTPSTSAYAFMNGVIFKRIDDASVETTSIINVIAGHTAAFSSTQNTFPGFDVTPSGTNMLIEFDQSNLPGLGAHHFIPRVVLTDTSDSSTETLTEQTITIHVQAVPPSPFYAGEYSSLNVPEFVPNSNSGFNDEGALTDGASADLFFPASGEWAVFNLPDSAITNPATLTFKVAGITLPIDFSFPAPTDTTDPDYDAASVGYTSYWLRMTQGSQEIIIRFS